MKVVLAATVRLYLSREAAYLRDNNPAAARNFSERIKGAIKRLQSFRDLGLESQELLVPGMRRLIVGDYLIDYEVAKSELWIVAIRHVRQKPPTSDIEPDFNYEADD